MKLIIGIILLLIFFGCGDDSAYADVEYSDIDENFDDYDDVYEEDYELDEYDY